MSSWRVDRHYGFGGARIPLQAEVHRGSSGGLREGLGTIGREFFQGGPLAATRRLAGQFPAIVLVLMLFAAFVVTLSKDRSDSPIEVVMLETIEPLAPPIPPLEPVMPEEPPIPLVEIEPPPPPIPEEIPEPVLPEVVKLVERPEPPPPPSPRPRAKPRPQPVLPKIAKLEAPKPPPVVRPDRPDRALPRPAERPRVAIARLDPEPAPTVRAPERVARLAVDRPSAARPTPRLEAPAAPVPDSQPSPPERTFRLAATRPAPGERPKVMPGMAPAPVERAPRPSASQPTRASTPRPTTSSARVRSPIPELAVAAAPDAPSQAPVPTRVTRGTRATPRNAQPAAPRPAAALARAPRMPAAAPTKLASRVDRAAPSAAPTGPAASRPGVGGVPLGDLAACVNDREEDRLKQAVVAAVKTQEECVSRKGTYRFVETKNLNAFLMWIDRAPSREAEDRCAELRYALECLQSDSQRAAR